MGLATQIGLITGSPGRWLLSKIARILDQLAFFYICLKYTVHFRNFGKRLMYRIIIQQIYFTGVQSLELIAFLSLLVGGLMMVQGITQLARLGSLDEMSLLVNVVLVREMGPFMTAIIVTLRSGSAIAMEIGYMNVLGEIEGLEMQGIPALHFICFPRLVGVTVAVLCLIILFDLIAIFGGLLAYVAVEGTGFWYFFYNLAGGFSASDFFVVTIKGVVFGLIIPVICLYNGFAARGSITEVPPCVSRALVDCLIYCVFFNIIITAAFF